MSEILTTARRSPLPPQGQALGGITLAPVAPRTRLILRGEAACEAAGAVLGLAIPRQPNRAATLGERAALWLGPDEWMLIAPVSEHQALIDLVARVVIEPHSLVDVSHRNAALTVSGSKVEAVLNAGNPLDLDVSAFPVGMCTRTLLGKCEIILWRTGPFTFHIEAFRSFMPYVHAFLTEAAREYTGG